MNDQCHCCPLSVLLVLPAFAWLEVTSFAKGMHRQTKLFKDTSACVDRSTLDKSSLTCITYIPQLHATYLVIGHRMHVLSLVCLLSLNLSLMLGTYYRACMCTAVESWR